MTELASARPPHAFCTLAHSRKHARPTLRLPVGASLPTPAARIARSPAALPEARVSRYLRRSIGRRPVSRRTTWTHRGDRPWAAGRSIRAASGQASPLGRAALYDAFEAIRVWPLRRFVR